MEAMFYAIVAFALAAPSTKRLLGFLQKRAVLDMPTGRGNHSVPTPRGGGIAVTGTILLLWSLYVALHPPLYAVSVLAGGALLLAGISWWDDVKGLPPLPRLVAQGFAVGMGLSIFPAMQWPGGAEWLAVTVPVAFLAWVWFINLYNFMDGIDGITGVETLHLSAGVAVVAWLAGVPLAPLAAIIFGAAAGFLVWNWHPARIFLGDVGSIPLGFLLGFLLLVLAFAGAWAPALILPAYYLADSGITLARRLLAGHKPWEPHSEHFYQKAVRAGASHARVARSIAVCNMGLFTLAMGAALTPEYALFALGAAAAWTGAFLLVLQPKKA